MTRARGIRWAVAIAVVVACGLVVSCSHSNVRRVSGQEFQRLAASDMTTLRSTQYIGATGTRAYLEDWHYSSFEKDSTAVVWTPLSELPPELARDLKMGKNPWSRAATGPTTQP